MKTFILRSRDANRSSSTYSWSLGGNTDMDFHARLWLSSLSMPNPDITIVGIPDGYIAVNGGADILIPKNTYTREPADFAVWLSGNLENNITVVFNKASNRLVFTNNGGANVTVTLNARGMEMFGVDASFTIPPAGQYTGIGSVRTSHSFDDLIIKSNISKDTYISYTGGVVTQAGILGVCHGEPTRSYRYEDNYGLVSTHLAPHERLNELSISFETLKGFPVVVDSDFYIVLRLDRQT